MAGIYIYSDNNEIAAEIIGFAKRVGKEAVLLAFDEKTAEVMGNSGADKIYLLNGESELVESYAKAVAELLQKEEAELFAVGSTARGRELAARAAGYLDCALVSDVSALSYADGWFLAERMMYGGLVQQRESLDGLGVVTVPGGKFDPVTGNAEVISMAVQADRRVSLVETAPIVRQGADLSQADKVVCVGMGLDKEEDLETARALAEAIGAEIACTRGIAEERHWLPAELYIGISGAVIKPKLYVSLGVSGQIQHIFGIRDSQLIVGIDTNERAPIFKAADYGIVGDLYEIVPLLTDALKKQTIDRPE
ncbi:MAG: electron transfer flavoprotein subunit alpha/FixB family protein [Syntrophomonadaceae bacterium]|nr:electron transfer flavoprotein subunit alpha/FixB family protein [Syntrophomonadaceae bacterium]